MRVCSSGNEYSIYLVIRKLHDENGLNMISIKNKIGI